MYLAIAQLAFLDATQAQTLTTLFSFTDMGGVEPAAPLIQGPDGSFYGTTAGGGIPGPGTIFKVTAAGAFTTLHSFNGLDGASPYAGLTLGTDGNFYGTVGGTTGAVFKITPAGVFTTLHAFTGTDGQQPAAALTLGTDGNFYGTAAGGGTQYACTGNYLNGCGTVFRITPSGTLTTLHSFGGADGANPVAPLTLGSDGNFYGATAYGGPLGVGTIFQITAAGTLTTLHYFSGSDGATPLASLTQGADGNFYGTAATGVFGGPSANGTAFKITPAGVFTTLHAFSGADGQQPAAALALGRDGNFYGTTRYGGPQGCTSGANFSGCGTVFMMSSTGILTTLYRFSGTDGQQPVAALTLGSNGNFYGTTLLGGTNQGGTFFSLDVANSALSVNANGAVNAATFNSPVAPGSIAGVFGNFLIQDPISSTTLPIPTSMAGLSIQFGTAPPAPLFFGSQSQINVQIPWELAGQAETTVAVTQDGQTSATRTVMLAMYAPGIFTADSQTGQGAVLDADFQLVGPTNPTAAGAYVQIYCTGLGPVTSPPATGSPALANPLSWTTIGTTVTIGGAPANVVFSGLVPGDVGLYQVNAQVPAASTKGPSVPVTISVGGVTSNTVTIAVQ